MDDLESTSMPNVGGTGLAVGAADGDDAKGENKEQGSRDEQAEQEDSGSETEEYDAETVESDADMEEDEPFPDCFVCKVCERGQIKSPFFSELPAIFPHLVDVHEISDPQARISGEGSQSVKDSPHIRLIPSYQAFGGWGISFLSGPVEGSGH
ncbi:hypothetical protein FS749_011446 [Ceratobasidium sp. UAMH 11750]|nr:hypothetical protein FS749_011446 [Ceratobasidium sp. UAMH 11750]